jgi:hypothetical protein
MKRLYARLMTVVALAVLAPLSALAGGVPWQEPINTTDRFIVLTSYQNNAVFDAETGLVWERSPDTNARNWQNAQVHCNQKTVGNRKGWRLPTVQELASLVDPNNLGGNPDLPPGHPSLNVQSSGYWSASTFAADTTTFAWFVGFSNGLVFASSKSDALFGWGVRGGQGPDAQ